MNLIAPHPLYCRSPMPRLAAVVASLLAAASHAAGLNDTGQTHCYDSSNAEVAVSSANCGDAATRPRQDGRYGRDPQAAALALGKVGAGSAGFDFTKIANDGSALPANATLGTAIGAWACTRDNVTGLIWEVKTTSGLRSVAHNYTWRSGTAGSNGGNPGDLGSNTCGGTLSAYGDQCNTENYILAVNTATLCGANNWRLPTPAELLGMLHLDVSSTSVDGNYFPNTGSLYWTSATHAASPELAWAVNQSTRANTGPLKSAFAQIRLVREAP